MNMDLIKYEKELNKAGYFISTDQVVNSRGDVVGQMDPYGEFHCSSDDVLLILSTEPKVEVKKTVKKIVKKPVKKTLTSDFDQDWGG
tara:strand:+ start:711 stop:971 length:261 start_codon:yes stop_codon:yes gene_type:complete